MPLYSQAEAYFSPAQILQFATEYHPYNRKSPVGFGPSLQIPKGLAMGRKLSNNLCYPFNKNANDGTQTFAGFNEYSLATDANSNVYWVFGSTPAGPTWIAQSAKESGLLIAGAFSPTDLLTAAAGTPVAEVDTITPGGTITAADQNIIVLPSGAQIEFTTATTTAAAVVTGLKAAWAANAEAVALATTSGTSTLILTAVTPGVPLNLTTSVIGVGTLVKVVTTPASYGAQAEIDTFTPGGTITTGDVNNITITYPNNQQLVISFTTGATTTATAVSAGLIAAWNASPAAAQYGTASGTTTFIVTGQVGSAMNLTSSVTGVGTLTQVITQAAYGQNIADIIPSRPGAYVEVNGWWIIP